MSAAGPQGGSARPRKAGAAEHSAALGAPHSATSSLTSMLLFLALHVLLALAMRSSWLVATGHALVTLLIALRVVMTARTPDRLIPLLGYIIAVEPLWRVGHARIFYESGKYALAGLSILALIRFRLWRRADKAALGYFALLLPALLVLPEFNRQEISFNLSGPFALASATFFLSAWPISRQILLRVFLLILTPTISLALLGTFFTLTAENINFYTSKVASAGLGNNQASSTLALAGFVAFCFYFLAERDRILRRVVGLAGLWCTAQAALTFSRGGVATAAGAAAVTGFFLLRDRRSRGALITQMTLLGIVLAYLVVPLLVTVTSGAIKHRFTDRDLTGRDRLIEADLLAFQENPILGVGPGKSRSYHRRFHTQATTHTEYSRLAAEHGVFGIAALLLLLWMILKRLVSAAPKLDKAIAAGCFAWCLLFMFHASMRMAAPSLFFALGVSILQPSPRRQAATTHPAGAIPRRVRTRRGPVRELSGSGT